MDPAGPAGPSRTQCSHKTPMLSLLDTFPAPLALRVSRQLGSGPWNMSRSEPGITSQLAHKYLHPVFFLLLLAPADALRRCRLQEEGAEVSESLDCYLRDKKTLPWTEPLRSWGGCYSAESVLN